MASMSKRAQARNEKELHDLLNVAGNSQCADCGARNPSWASWNIGVFLCMRCASIHRKLGTHISKVKSLSMDTWSSDQVESMKMNGNLAVNKTYNPKNKQPDMPLDADEVDSAMERYIRKKYQEKSLVDGRPEPPSRSEASPPVNRSPQPTTAAQLPPRKHKFFGFGLRASSDKKNPKGEPKVDSAFRITSDEHSSPIEHRKALSDHDLQIKLAQLHDMGFTDNEQNTNMLKRHGGDVERSINSLVKLAQKEPPKRTSSKPQEPVRSTVSNTASQSTPTTSGASNNPWGQPADAGISFVTPQQPEPSNNPWQASVRNQADPSLEQSFQNLQVSTPLFPHSTGGYSMQPQLPINQRMQTMTPPVGMGFQQSAYVASPSTVQPVLNPFYQPPLSTQSTGSNPFFQQAQSQPSFAPTNNPFMGFGNSPSQQNQNTTPPTILSNPFGLPPDPSTSEVHSAQTQAQFQSTNPFGVPQQNQVGIQHAQTFPLGASNTQQSPPQLPQAFPNFQYGQPRSPTQFNQQQQIQQPAGTMYQGQQQQFLQQQTQPLMAQQTGRYTKNDIMALFNHPQLAPVQQPLPSIPEPSAETSSQQQPQPTLSPQNPYGEPSLGIPRSSTAPVAASNMYSAGGGGSRNPFLSTQSSRQSSNSSASPAVFSQSQVHGYPSGPRHASNESVSVNNPSLMDGRHSPDAFASLSARYVR